MKKMLLLAVLVSVAAVGSMVAQPTFFFGASGGANFSKLHFNGFKNEYNNVFYAGKDYTSAGKIGFQGGLRIGANISEKVSLVIEPTFLRKKLEMGTKSSTFEDIRIGKNNYIRNAEGNRTWTFNTNSLHVPVMVRFKFFGDQIGLYGSTGLSFNTTFSGDYVTKFEDKQGQNNENGNPILGVYDLSNPAITGNVTYSEEYPDSGDKLKFGDKDLDHFDKNDVAFLLGLGTYFNLNDDGTARITLDWRWDAGLTNMYSKARKDYLSGITGQVTLQDLDDARNWTVDRQRVNIDGKQRASSHIISIGVEFCPSCGF